MNFKKIKNYLATTALLVPLTLAASGAFSSTTAQTKDNFHSDKNKHTITAQNFQDTYSRITEMLGNEFTPKEKSALENSLKVTGWYNSNLNDSLEVFLDKNLYSNSGGNYILPNDEKDKKIFQWTNGTPAVNFYQVGSGHGKFKTAETQRDKSTTVSNLFNQGNFLNGEKEGFLFENFKLIYSDVNEVYDADGKLLDVTPNNLGVITNEEDFKTSKNHETTDGKSIDNHLLLERGQKYSMPERNALFISNVDVNSINTFADAINAYDGDFNELRIDYKALSNDNESLNEKLGELSNQLKIMSGKYKKASEKLSDWSAGPMVTINSNGEVGYGLFSTLPFLNNKVSLGALYTSLKDVNNTMPTSVVSDTKHHPVLPYAGHSVETTNGGSSITGHDIDAILGVNVTGNLSLLAGLNLKKQNTSAYESKVNETWFTDDQGTKLDYQRIETDLPKTNTKNTKVSFEPGAMYDAGPVKIIGLYDIRNKEFKGGLALDIGALFK